MRNLFQRHEKVYLDTSIFIYFVEHHSSYHKPCEQIFKAIETGSIKAATSTLTLLEILVQPYKLKKEDIVLKFYSLFTTYPNIKWIDLTLSIADIAARFRAEYQLKTPDSIQIASAISSGATAFVCNDRVFQKIKGIECLLVEDFI